MNFVIVLIAGFGKVKSQIGLSGHVLIIDQFVEHDFYAEPFHSISNLRLNNHQSNLILDAERLLWVDSAY